MACGEHRACRPLRAPRGSEASSGRLCTLRRRHTCEGACRGLPCRRPIAARRSGDPNSCASDHVGGCADPVGGTWRRSTRRGERPSVAHCAALIRGGAQPSRLTLTRYRTLPRPQPEEVRTASSRRISTGRRYAPTTLPIDARKAASDSTFAADTASAPRRGAAVLVTAPGRTHLEDHENPGSDGDLRAVKDRVRQHRELLAAVGALPRSQPNERPPRPADRARYPSRRIADYQRLAVNLPLSTQMSVSENAPVALLPRNLTRRVVFWSSTVLSGR